MNIKIIDNEAIRPTETISLMSQEKMVRAPPDIIKEIKNKNKQIDSPQTETRPINTTTNNSNIIKKKTTTDDTLTINSAKTNSSNSKINNKKDSDIANDKEAAK